MSHIFLLVVIDPTTESQYALEKAAAFSRQVNAELILLACVYDPHIAGERFYDGPDLEKLRSASLNHQLESLQKLAEPLRENGLSVKCTAVWDRPLHEGIVREVLRLKPDFVVKDTHHHSAISRALFTNTDWHLIRDCPCTLWLVKPTAVSHPASVMAAVDPTHEHDKPAALDHRIIEKAQLLSMMFEERLHLAHSYYIPTPAITGSFSSVLSEAWPIDKRVSEEIKKVHTDAFETLAEDTGFPADQLHLRQGDPMEVLPALAGELNAGVVVMGAVSRTRPELAVLGSTAERTLDQFPCDVVIVKLDGFESPLVPDKEIHRFMIRHS